MNKSIQSKTFFDSHLTINNNCIRKFEKKISKNLVDFFMTFPTFFNNSKIFTIFFNYTLSLFLNFIKRSE